MRIMRKVHSSEVGMAAHIPQAGKREGRIKKKGTRKMIPRSRV